jgi:ribosome maturation factor RimP
LFWEEVGMAQELAARLIDLLEPLAADHGLELVTVEVAGGGHRTVRVYLDREGGIDIDTIAEANPWVSEALDGVQALSGPYTLEVSSPGIERVLRTRRVFERFCGSTIRVETARPFDGRSRFTGTLAAFQDDTLVLDVDGEEHRVAFDAVERARLKTDWTDSGEKSGRNR